MCVYLFCRHPGRSGLFRIFLLALGFSIEPAHCHCFLHCKSISFLLQFAPPRVRLVVWRWGELTWVVCSKGVLVKFAHATSRGGCGHRASVSH
jgi:hypothetical protein